MFDQVQKIFERPPERREVLGRVKVVIEKRDRGLGLVFELSNEEAVKATTLVQLLTTIGTQMQRVHDDTVIREIVWGEPKTGSPSKNGGQGWQPPPIVRRRKYT